MDVEDWLTDEEGDAERRLADAFERFEGTQPELADRVGDALGKTDDEVALALGYFLTVAVWLGFDQAFGARVGRLGNGDIAGVEESLALDEQLRGSDPDEAVDSDDVVAMEQPHLLAFVHEHLEAALETHAVEADLDGIHAVYRLILIEVLALSYAVDPPKDFVGTSNEICA